MASSKKPRQSDLPGLVENILKQRVEPGQRLTVALSGGLDSVVLLDILDRLRAALAFQFCAVHVNHQLSPNAAEWADFCAQLCRARGIPLEIAVVDVPRDSGMGLEAAARKIRYEIFYRQAADYVTLAHHLDDQAETVLLQLLRGAGVKGLSAMPVSRQQVLPSVSTQPVILRPLLEIPRASLECYAYEAGLKWIEDESNDNIGFARNYLRHEVLPLLEKRFPAYRDTLLRVSRHAAEAAELLDDLAQIDMQAAVKAGRLDLEKLRGMEYPRAKNLLRYFLSSHQVPTPDAERLDEMLRQLLHAREDAGIVAACNGYEVRRYHGEAYVESVAPALDPALRLLWQGEPELRLDALNGVLSMKPVNGSGISYAKFMQAPVTIRLRQGGEQLQPDCKRPHRSLKNLLQEAQIRPWWRDRLPLLYSGEHLVAVPGVGIDCEYQAGADEAGLQPDWAILYT